MSTEQPAVRILCTCAHIDAVRAAGRHAFRAATVDPVHTDALRRLPSADGLVVEGAEHARIARATGFDGGIVIAAEPHSADDVANFALQGTHFAAPLGGEEALVDALRAAIPVVSGDLLPADPRMARTRRLLAAGELASKIRHAFNNPLTALMAEIQLLQIEARDEDTRLAANRMLELVRRLTEVSRSLESVRDR